MVQIMKVRARWGGFQGSPGYSIFHFGVPESVTLPSGRYVTADVQGAVDEVRAFFVALQTILPQEATVQVESEVDVLESDTGELLYTLSAGLQALVRGTGTGNYSVAAGAVVSWRTGAIRNGRRIRGRTFLVPLALAAFGINGQLSAGAIQLIDGAAEALKETGTGPVFLVIWSRPTGDAPNGEIGFVLSSQVPAKGAILRSRRD